MDLQIDDNGFIFTGGDFLIGKSNRQEIGIIVEEREGNIKLSPKIGLDGTSYLNSSELHKIKSDAFYQVKSAGNTMTDLTIEDDVINIICNP